MAATLPADLSKVDPTEAWKPWQPANGDWNRKWAAHLYRRAAFGATPPEIDKAISNGYTKTSITDGGEPDAGERLEAAHGDEAVL